MSTELCSIGDQRWLCTEVKTRVQEGWADPATHLPSPRWGRGSEGGATSPYPVTLDAVLSSSNDNQMGTGSDPKALNSKPLSSTAPESPQHG